MCGLVGVAGAVNTKGEKAFKTLLILDQVRGEHSTGILSVDSSFSTEVLKKVGGHSELKQYKAYDGIFRKVNRVLIGHNRWATQGAVNNINAHPFELNTLIGAHNGTLRNKAALPDSHKFEVDSENLYHAIEKDGLEASIKITNGAYALTWWNKEEKSLNLLRNSERPLYFCYSTDKKTLFWASEEWMLEIALAKASIKHGDIYSLKEMAHWKISFEGYKAGQEFPKGEVTQMKPFVPQTYTSSGSSVQKKSNPSKKMYLTGDIVELKMTGFASKGLKGSGGDYLIGSSDQHEGVEFRVYTHKGSQLWKDLWGQRGGTKISGRVMSYAPNVGRPYYRLNNNSILVLSQSAGYRGHQGKVLSKEEWEESVSRGCAMCRSPITHPSQVGDWFDDDNPVCTDCKEDFKKIWN